MNDDNLLVGGFYPKPPRDGAPEFVIGKININVEQFKTWFRDYLKENPDEEWLSIDTLISKGGKGYGKVDTWKPEPKQGSDSPAAFMPKVEDEDVPF